MKTATGVRARHSRLCPTYRDRDARCRCHPTYEAYVLDRDGRKIRRTFPTAVPASRSS